MLERATLFHVERASFGREVRIYVSAQREDGRIEVLAPMVTQVREYDDDPPAEAALRMRPETAQHLMDALWAAGFRAVESNGSAGQLGAVQRHLNDMRALVEHALTAKLP